MNTPYVKPFIYYVIAIIVVGGIFIAYKKSGIIDGLIIAALPEPAAPTNMPEPTNEVFIQPIVNTPTPLPPVKEDAIIKTMVANWVSIQKGFSIKAGESGTYNSPVDAQFIAANKILVHYDDGLTDHITLLQYSNGKFSEIKTLATMKMFTLPEWQVMFNENGDAKYTPKNYTTGIPINNNYVTFDALTRVDVNSMVR